MKLRALLFAVFVLAGAGCFIAGGDFSGAGCRADEDCKNGYLCVSSAKWPQVACADAEEGCVCEIKFPPEGVPADGGGPVVDAGPPPDAGSWCADFKTLFLRSCVGTCHNDNPVFSSPQAGTAPKGFRLDSYADVGTNLGVRSKLDRVKARCVDQKDMPPVSEAIAFPFSAAERAQVDRWIRYGAPEGPGAPCDTGIFTNDAGQDGGTDGGTDAGLVSFSAQVAPIFQTRCGPCHITGTSGGLSLTAANAYAQLVGPNATCNAAVRRVTPSNTQASMLWRKLMNTADKCGVAMPSGTAGLATTNPVEFGRIQTWIQQGALNN